MTYAMMNRPTDWMPLDRHKRSQNAGVAYTLVDDTVAVVDALMRISSPTQVDQSCISKPRRRSMRLLGSSVHTGSFRAAASIGIFRGRLPVAAKMALATAGTMADVPHSPIPPGGSELCTTWTSIAGAASLRNIP